MRMREKNGRKRKKKEEKKKEREKREMVGRGIMLEERGKKKN